MRTIMNLTKFHMGRLLKEPSKLVVFVLMPTLVVCLFYFLGHQPNIQSQEDSSSNIIVLGEDNPTLARLLEVHGLDKMIQTDKQAALSSLQKGTANLVYEFPTDYLERIAEKPSLAVTVYRRNSEMSWPRLEQIIQQGVYQANLNNQLSQAHVQNKGIMQGHNIKVEVVEANGEKVSSEISTYIILLIVYILMDGVSVGNDLVVFKKERSLRRSLVAPLESWKITLSYLLAYALFMLVANGMFILILNYFVPMGGTMRLQAFILIGLAILFSCAFGLALFRIFKEPTLCQSIGTLLWLGMIGLAFLTELDSIGVLRNIGYLSPFAWIIEILDTGSYFPNVVVLMMMILVMFTAGNFKLENYVKE